jgi:3-hydroxybutyryl-CoA dehydrogenase
MGHGIALVCAENGCFVALCDLADDVLSTARERIRSDLTLAVEMGLEQTEYVDVVLSRIKATTDLAVAVRDAQFVTEAVPEDVSLKRAVFRQIEAACGDRTILASNTSTLPIDEIGKSVRRRERLIVTHWFNPPHLVPVVEVARGEATSDDTFRRTFAFLTALGKDPVTVLKQVPGFLVNRIQTAMFREVMALLEEGVASAGDIDKAVRGSIGIRLAAMGPCAVVDFGGVDLWYKGAQNLYPSLDGSKGPRKLWTDMVEDGRLGARTGKGFFEYEPSAVPEIIKERDMKLRTLLEMFYRKREKGV